MSKIGNQNITIPEGVMLSEKKGSISVTGPKGTLMVSVPKGIRIEKNQNILSVKRSNDSSEQKSLHGLTRTLIANAIEGVTKGFSKTLEVKGVGYRAKMTGNTLVLTVGFSHVVEIPQPEGIKFETKGTKIVVSGIDKQYVGEVAARIRRVRPPDAYKGKGIRYEGEYIRLKPGKAAKTAA